MDCLSTVSSDLRVFGHILHVVEMCHLEITQQPLHVPNQYGTGKRGARGGLPGVSLKMDVHLREEYIAMLWQD